MTVRSGVDYAIIAIIAEPTAALLLAEGPEEKENTVQVDNVF